MMEEQKKWVIIGVLLVILILIGAGGVYWYYYKTRQASQALEKPKAEEASPPSPAAETKPGEGKEGLAEPPLKLPGLDQSDDFARQMLKGLSPHGKITDWLRSKNIIRVMTAAIDNIAAGKSPRAHLGFLFQGQVFPVTEKEGKIYLDPKGYERYDLLADAFVSLNTGRTVQAYEKAKPLFQEAYRELGYPQKDFHATLIKAIQKVLEAPTVEREILLKEEGKGVNFLYVDDALEELNEVQKHMLRMGPKNTRKIQQKLREMALALGVPESQLPQPKAYTARSK
jgi:hypothetical protein